MSSLVSEEYGIEHSSKCCCGIMHVETGIKIIAGLGVLGLIFSIIGMFISVEPIGASIASVVSEVLILGCLIASLVTKKDGYLIPYLILQVLGLLFRIVVLIVLIVKRDTFDDKSGYYEGITSCVIGILFGLWVISLIRGYYRYLMETEEQRLPIYE